MISSWLTLRDLQYVTSVAQHSHFGRAAKACHVSQPALSGQIKKLEDRLGITLFERTNRKVAITDIGRLFVRQAQLILNEAEKLSTLSKKSDSPLKGPFRLGIIATLGPYWVPRVLKSLKRTFPQLELLIREGLTDDLLRELQAGSLDAVLAAKTFPENGFAVRPVFREDFVLAVPTGHRFDRATPVQATELKSAEMVLLEDGHCLRDETLAICPAGRKGQAREFHAASIETLKHLVATSAGYTLIPALAVNENDRSLQGLLSYRRLAGKNLGRTIVLVCRSQFYRMEDIETLGSFIRKAANEIAKTVSGVRPAE